MILATLDNWSFEGVDDFKLEGIYAGGLTVAAFDSYVELAQKVAALTSHLPRIQSWPKTVLHNVQDNEFESALRFTQSHISIVQLRDPTILDIHSNSIVVLVLEVRTIRQFDTDYPVILKFHENWDGQLVIAVNRALQDLSCSLFDSMFVGDVFESFNLMFFDESDRKFCMDLVARNGRSGEEPRSYSVLEYPKNSAFV